MWRRRESKPRFSPSAGANGDQKLAIAGTCFDESQQPLARAGNFGSMEVRRRELMLDELAKAVELWEAGGDRPLLLRLALHRLS